MRLWVLVVVASCVSHDLTPCGDKLCPLGSRCVQDQYCVSDADAIACGDKSEGDACMVEGLPGGFCVEGNCIVPICGNLVEETGEACDDGNLTPGDNCSADCRSDESCGNGVIDLVGEEDCDSGVLGLSGDGCTSNCKKEYETWHDLTPRVLRARQQHRMVYDGDHGEIVLFGGFDGSEPLNDTWVFTSGAWEQRFPTSSPEPRYGHSMVYDSVRKKVYLFGGTNGTEVFGGTWEWNGTDWTKLPLTTGPTERFNAAIAFHTQEQRTYLFGGWPTPFARVADTWTFDGVTWTKIDTADDELGGSLLQLGTPTLAYDPIENELLLLGKSRTSGDTRGEALTWFNNRWTDLLDPQDIAWMDASLVYDPLRQKIVLAAGASSGGVPSGTVWEWNWASGMFEPSVTIGARSRAAIAGTPAGLVMFGGKSSGSTSLSSTLSRGLSINWTTVSTTPIPTGRAGAMATYDAAARRSLLYGGTDTTPLADNWFWSDALWTKGPSQGPGARAYAGMTYDEVDEETVLFGGTDGTEIGIGSNGQPIGQCARPDAGVLDAGASPPDAGVPSQCEFADTWTFANGVWTREHPMDSPSGRVFAATTYDAARDRVMLFGGTRANGTFNDTWVWDRTSSTWTQLAPLVVPPKLLAPRMTYDRHRDVAVLYGTYVDGDETRGELWEFDGAMWIPRVTTIAPPPRNGAVLVYDPRRRTTLLFGGTRPSGQLVDDTWEWEGPKTVNGNPVEGQWMQRFPSQKPTPRANAAALYDPIRGKVLVFGGQGILGIRLDDVWAFGFEAPGVSTENCELDGDEDSDGLNGCEDPDCWGSCTPTCPPGASC